MEGGVTPFSSSMAPSGSYILIVVSQPMTEEHKQIILQRLDKGLLSWDVSSSGCDLSGLEYAFSTNIKDRVAESDVLIQHSTESLGVEVLLSPTVRTLKQCVKNLLSTPTSHKQLIHAGYTFAGSGSWILENGIFSFAEFLEIFQQAAVQNQKRCVLNVHCAEEGDWSKTNFAKDIFTKTVDISLNPPEKVNHVPGSEHLIKCLDNALIIQSLEELMKPSPLVGNIRFNRPTIYMFPAGQGDCALFGINGFNMLIDGGFHRKPCSWDFVRHLDRLDAVLVTRIGESNICGMSTLMKRNALNNANPQIGYVFCNIAENKSNTSKNGIAETKDDLIISVVSEGHNFVQTLNDLKLKPHQCWRDSSIDPFVLYHKVGQGTLEMHVLSPPRDSKEMKLFLSEWNAYKETFSGVKSELKGVESMIPLSHATSICAILVWRPEDPKDTITRILFPGSAPQYKILEGLEKLKVLNILNHPVVTKSSLNVPASKVISNKVEKSVSRASIPNRNNTASPALSVSSIASRNGDIGGLKKDVSGIRKINKEIKKEHKEVKKEIKKEIKKDVAKKEVKTENTVKRESLAKKESVKDAKKDIKDVKKITKKENKDLKSVNDKEAKPTPKKDFTTPTVKATTEVKKSTTSVKKSITPVKKDAGKPPIAPKTTDTKKTVSKVSESKTPKDVNKKSVENKMITKAKPKTSASSKPSATPKTKPIAVPKPGSKMTKAVAASSVVASAVAVTVAAVELNEKKDTIEDTEPEVSEKEEIIAESKEIAPNEKSVEEVISPLPLEAVSPTPSESVSLTPSDTLSSAPLETVSPTPPLPNEPISTEEKDVNEIKDLEQDMPYEKVAEIAYDDLKTENEINEIESELEKPKISNDVMSTSFIAENQVEDTFDEQFRNTDFEENKSTPLKIDSDKEDISNKDDFSEDKDTEEEKNLDEDIYERQENVYVNADEEKQFVKEVDAEKEIVEEKDEEKDVSEEKEIMEEKDIIGEKENVECKYVTEGKENLEDDIIEETKILKETDNILDEKEIIQKNSTDEKDIDENKETPEYTYLAENDSSMLKDTVEDAYTFEKIGDVENVSQEKFVDYEKEVEEEKYFVGEKELRTDDTDIVEEKDDIKEKDMIQKDSLEKQFEDTIDEIHERHDKNELKNIYEENNEVDDQLAGLTMEGSFCAGMISPKETMAIEEVQHFENKSAFDDHNLSYATDIAEKQNENDVSKCESHFRSEISKSEAIENKSEYIKKEFNKNSDEPCIQAHSVAVDNYKSQEIENLESIAPESLKMETDCNKQINYTYESYNEDILQRHRELETNSDLDELSKDFRSDESHFDKFSHIHSMEASFHQDSYGDYEPTNIDDLEMQETSVDEPDEINRKESVVSVILNDENAEHYTDSWRRKSGTESEDDVDIGKYMSKDQIMNEENLSVRRGSDSDGEDVVKSPTPHAVVNYEGQLDGIISAVKPEIGDSETEINVKKEMCINDKEDFDEKDKDSAEEQDFDDGEMIRHPTPPEMKYSEDEMRDPIGQHFITNPSLKAQVSDITDQPLYEEAEDSGSERSVSPIIEQPVFGNAIEADFPELVTVSGGTTPSEPQSPKANFDAKKFVNDGAVMEALSEHDVSDSSTHSPSCQDTAFDLQGSERSVIEVQSLQDEVVNDENKQNLALNECVSAESQSISANEIPQKIETETYDDKDDKQEDKQETPSDEEESSSEDENSESHSKDKSDAMDDKSDVERDDKSDIHNDDKSDHHQDKSDVANDDDDDKSDIHEDEQLYRQQSKHMEHEENDGFQRDLKADVEDYNTETKCFNTDYESHEKQFTTCGDQYRYSPDVHKQYDSDVEQELDRKNNFNSSKSPCLENSETNKSIYDKDRAFVENINEINTDLTFPVEPLDSNQDCPSYHSNTIDAASNILQYQTSENYEPNFQYGSSSNESIVIKDSIASDYDVTNNQDRIVSKSENEDKIEKSENYDTFQTNEANFENSQRDINIHGLSTFTVENKNENASVEHDFQPLTENMSDYSHEVPSGFGDFEHHEVVGCMQLHENISSQHTESTITVENEVLSGMTETHQYVDVSQYDERQHITNQTYTEDCLIENNVPSESLIETHFSATPRTDANEVDFTSVDSQPQSFANNHQYEYSAVDPTDTITEISGYQQNASYNETVIVNESYSKTSEYGEENVQNFNEQYIQSEIQHRESHTEKEMPSEFTSENFEVGNTKILVGNDVVSEDTIKVSTDMSEFKMVNGKDDTSSFSLPSSELKTEFYSSESSHKEITATNAGPADQQSTYLINNRFHSDSPEDNTMRSDSSPDVPYPDLPDKFSDIKNSMSVETCSETYIHSTEEYKNNMNFASTDTIPLSTQNDLLNANQNNTYGESSEDERSSPVRDNMSPYAYTNKAYAREEEDVDGNHIYKEETAEVIKQVEFDGNNLQTLSTNQVSSVMNYSQEYQDIQYSTSANYDFHLEEWGKPMGLPTPPDSSQKTLKKGEKLTVKSKTAIDANGKSPSVSSKLSSPLKKPKPKVAKESSSSPIYVDLAYVPQHADPQYCDVEFFKKIRARYYVISSVNPSKEVLNALLEAKKTWNEDLSVTIIPTYETDTLGYWMAQNQDDLTEYSIDVSPSASRCTVNLQDHQTSCSAYRLEF